MNARDAATRAAPLVLAPIGIGAVDRLADHGPVGLGFGVIGLLGVGAAAAGLAARRS